MKLRILFAAALTGCVISGPASAQSLSAYGVWGDGPHLKKSSGGGFGMVPTPSMLGGPPAVASAVPQTGKPKELLQGGPKPSIAPMAPQKVSFNGEYSAGSVVIDQSAKKLYYLLGSGQAYAYPVAVGKKGFSWTGTEKVSKVVNWPDWTPPEEMRQRKPHLPLKMTGGLNNPLGAKAIYLGNTLYRIHGTNDSSSIGTAASSGCIRMLNAHVVHLAGLVSSGTTVHVVKALSKTAVRSGGSGNST